MRLWYLLIARRKGYGLEFYVLREGERWNLISFFYDQYPEADFRKNLHIRFPYRKSPYLYHNVLINDGEKLYYQNRLDRNVRNFVRGKLPSDLEVSLYIVIDTKENIDKLTNILNETNIKDDIDLVTYLYHKDINGVDYWYLKINSRQARKENLIQYIKDKENKDMLVVCGAGHTDLPLIEKADLSMCLESAPDYIKEKVDIVINGDTEKIIRIFDKMYHSYNPKNTITKLISEYNNKKE